MPGVGNLFSMLPARLNTLMDAFPQSISLKHCPASVQLTTHTPNLSFLRRQEKLQTGVNRAGVPVAFIGDVVINHEVEKVAPRCQRQDYSDGVCVGGGCG